MAGRKSIYELDANEIKAMQELCKEPASRIAAMSDDEIAQIGETVIRTIYPMIGNTINDHTGTCWFLCNWICTDVLKLKRPLPRLISDQIRDMSKLLIYYANNHSLCFDQTASLYLTAIFTLIDSYSSARDPREDFKCLSVFLEWNFQEYHRDCCSKHWICGGNDSTVGLYRDKLQKDWRNSNKELLAKLDPSTLITTEDIYLNPELNKYKSSNITEHLGRGATIMLKMALFLYGDWACRYPFINCIARGPERKYVVGDYDYGKPKLDYAMARMTGIDLSRGIPALN